MRVLVSRGVAVAAAALFISSCADQGPVSPKGTDASRLITGPTRMAVVTWDAPLTSPASASAQIGVLGGVISLPETGLTITVPAFAVSSTTTITVTAVPGNMVAYEFEPHGLRFNAPVVVTQGLAGTSAARQTGLIPGVLYGGYFADVSALDQLGGTALVDEILRVSIDRVLGRATFSVLHFSGYLLGTGEADPSGGAGTQ
jgi:hypothetical protein